MFRVFFLSFLLTSCGVHLMNWQGSSTPGLDTAHYDHFNQVVDHRVKLSKGDLLFVEYAVVSERGSTDLDVYNGQKEIWHRKNIRDSGNAYFIAPDAGKYNIRISGHDAAGGYALRYTTAKPKTIKVKNSVNIELFGLMLQLDNGADFIASKDTVMISGRNATWSQWYALAVENYTIYKGFDTCRAMQLYRKLQGEGVYNDFFVDFLIQVDEAPNAKINSFTDESVILGFSPKGDSAAARSRAEEFLIALNDFYRETSFAQYLQKHQTHYAQANAQVSANLPSGEFLPIIEHYYRQSFNAYYLVPSMNILTSMGFGKVNKSTRTIYNVFGPFGFQDFDPQHPDMAFNFPEKIKELTVHEFGHSFANPAVDSLPPSLVKSTAYLFEPIKKEMEKRAYPSWRICLYEHFVKAGEYMVAMKLGETSRAETFLKEAVAAGFIYVPFLAKKMQEWDAQVSPMSFTRAVRWAMEQLQTEYSRQ